MQRTTATSIELAAAAPNAGVDVKVKMPEGYYVQPKRNKQAAELQHQEHVQEEREEQLANKSIVYSAKRGYSVLLLMTLVLLAMLAIYILTYSQQIFYLFNGITGCAVSLLLMIPAFLLYRFAVKKLEAQHDTINDKIIETFSLKKKLQFKNEQNLQQQQYITDLKLIIAEQEKKLQKYAPDDTAGGNGDAMKGSRDSKLHLINGFRKGQMEIQIEFAEVDQLVAMLNVVVSCITLLPFGQTNHRKKLQKILTRKVEEDKYLQMHFYFFLLSYVDCHDVKRLFRRHRIMKKVKSMAEFYQYEADNAFDDAMTVLSDATSMRSGRSDMSAPFSPYTPDLNTGALANGSFPNVKGLPKFVNEPSKPMSEDELKENAENVVQFEEKDPIKLFRAPIDLKAKPGTRIVIPRKLQNRFFDPLNGNKFLEQLCVRQIFSSNAKPYLIDCFCKKSGLQQDSDQTLHDDEKYDVNINEIFLSSSFILKKGDDMRKDQAILQMFQFMNNLWRERGLRYQKGIYFVETLCYKCIPMGNDVGIIEMIPNCIQLNKVSKLANSFHTIVTETDAYSARNRYNRLITTAAAAYIASFVCGVRDRHHDNILINVDTCALFHIDFGYIFNDSTALDTAKFAITKDLKQVLNIYKRGWDDFIDLAVNAFMILRQNATELIDFARVAFAFLYKSNDIEQFIRESLKLEMEQKKAMQYIRTQIAKAPNKWRTKMKNLTHSLAQKMKKTPKQTPINSLAPRSVSRTGSPPPGQHYNADAYLMGAPELHSPMASDLSRSFNVESPREHDQDERGPMMGGTFSSNPELHQPPNTRSPNMEEQYENFRLNSFNNVQLPHPIQHTKVARSAFVLPTPDPRYMGKTGRTVSADY